MNKETKRIEQISQERIRDIINEYCNGNRMEFSEKTGIGKSSISQYVNGTNAPGSITASKIGEAFHLNPMWVMGFDVQKFSVEEHEQARARRLSAYALALLDIVDGMNDEGIKRLKMYAEDIKDKYRKDDEDEN